MGKFLNNLAIIIIIALGVWIILDRIRDVKKDEVFVKKETHLLRIIDSLKQEIPKKDSVVVVLFEINDSLQRKIDTLQSQVKIVVRYVDSSRISIDKLTEQELIAFYNERYPKDTSTNKLPVAQPVLIESAKDLVELDGNRKMLILKDSILSVINQQLDIKDSAIKIYTYKEKDYKSIIDIQDSTLKNWDNRFNELSKKHQRTKLSNKIIVTASGIIIAAILIL